MNHNEEFDKIKSGHVQFNEAAQAANNRWLASLEQAKKDLYSLKAWPGQTGKNGVRDYGHKHAEAFAIMEYSEVEYDQNFRLVRVGPESVYVWNSRDGVTPMGFTMNGKEYSHNNWKSDRYAPDYRPQPGDLIFRDITQSEAFLIAEKRIDWYDQNEPEQVSSLSHEERKQLIQNVADGLLIEPMIARVDSISFSSISIHA